MRVCLVLSGFLAFSVAFPEQGRFKLSFNSSQGAAVNGIVKNVYKNTKLFVKPNFPCGNNPNEIKDIAIKWGIRETPCWNEFAFHEVQSNFWWQYSEVLDQAISPEFGRFEDPPFYKETTQKVPSVACGTAINLIPIDASKEAGKDGKKASGSPPETPGEGSPNLNNTVPSESGPKVKGKPQFTFDHEGDYLFVVRIETAMTQGKAPQEFQADVDVVFDGENGYLSVVDWPLLPFYGVMCGVYVCMGIGWLVVCALHFKELLRIQFWIAGVIFLGMLEKACFYAEFQNINTNGVSAKGLIFAAELVSCAKRTLARMLVIIVSVGFGIVKPRLGPTLHRVVGVGGLYFVLASTEAYLRVIKPKNDISTPTMLAGVPLAVIDAAICWWVFSSLTQTLRTLRLRRNLVKFKLYRHFTNVLIFAVLASVVFMLVNIKLFKLAQCLKDWRELWFDEAFWHLLFSILLACIMVLWTPSNNNKRYAFQPLLDNDEDDSDDEDFNALLPDVYEGMKHRMNVLSNGKSDAKSAEEGGANPEEDPLKWVEENIPETGDNENPLPVLDSEEEIETTRFELSKMQ